MPNETCQCGQVVSVPDDAPDQAFACPKCSRVITSAQGHVAYKGGAAKPREATNRMIGALCGILLLSTLFVPWHFEFARAGSEQDAIVWPWNLLKPGVPMMVQVFLYGSWMLGLASFVASMVMTRLRLSIGYLVIACVGSAVLGISYPSVMRFGVTTAVPSPTNFAVLLLPVLGLPLLIVETMAHRVPVTFRSRAVSVLLASLLTVLVAVIQMVRISRAAIDWDIATSLGVTNQLKYVLAYAGAILLIMGAAVSIFENVTPKGNSRLLPLKLVYPGLVLSMLQLRPLSSYNISALPRSIVAISLLFLIVEAVASLGSELLLRKRSEAPPDAS